MLIQHLDPQHDSLLTEALSRATHMPVAEISDGMLVEPDHVYVIPPNADVGDPPRRADAAAAQHDAHAAAPAHRLLLPFARGRSAAAARSASSCRAPAPTAPRACRAIKAEDGIAFVQDPASAKFAGMPQSAIDAGVVDVALTPPRARRGARAARRHPYIAPSTRRGRRARSDDETLEEDLRRSCATRSASTSASTSRRRCGGGSRGAWRCATSDDLPGLPASCCSTSPTRRGSSTRTCSSTSRRSSATRRRSSSSSRRLSRHPRPTSATARRSASGSPAARRARRSTRSPSRCSSSSTSTARSRPIQIFGTDISETAIEIARAGVYSGERVARRQRRAAAPLLHRSTAATGSASRCASCASSCGTTWRATRPSPSSTW